MDKILTATCKTMYLARSVCLRTVYEPMVQPRSCGIIHITKSGTTNMGIKFAPHFPLHCRPLLPADCTNTMPLQTQTHTNTNFRGPPIAESGDFFLLQCFRKDYVPRFLLCSFCSFLVTQFPCLLFP